MSEISKHAAYPLVPDLRGLVCADEVRPDLPKQNPLRLCTLRYLFIAIRAFCAHATRWGPTQIWRRMAIAARLLCAHPMALWKIVGALATPKLLKLLLKEPIVFVKFSWPIYARQFSTNQRADLLSGHYRFLVDTLRAPFLDSVIEEGVAIWRFEAGPTQIEIRLIVSYPATLGEGELDLVFRINSMDVYVLSFVIVPQRLPGTDVANLVFVSRLQGTKGRADAIRLATKSMGDVSPPLILMAAVQGMALGLGVKYVVGIDARAQIENKRWPLSPDLLSAYDEFWNSIEGVRSPAGFFEFPVPLPEKPLAMIKQNHRPRVRSRRAFRRRVSEEVRAMLESSREHA